ncbi:MAPEG family protein [Methylopila musalis]|uniref:MAPEG family protein n=1 Tax=Methylopila musalis TaxID=1134781 RepID=A0ABW3ZB92_9HYPH
MTLSLWCVLIAAVLPIATVALAKWTSPGFDNGDPRGWATSTTGWRGRAIAAQQNGFEIFPLFAAAALTVQTLGHASATADALSAAFIALRVAYVACYLANLPTLRSAVWSLGFLAAVALFTLPVWA